MKNKKIQYWSTVHDDKLELVDKTVRFLQNEFCLDGTDMMWSPEYFSWKLGASNPAGKGYMSLAVEDDQVVGTISITKKRLLINGEKYLGAEIGDSYTAASIRRKGLPLDLSSVDSNPQVYKNKSIFGRLVSEVRHRAESDGVSLIYGTPNEFSYNGYVKHLGFVEVEKYVNKSYLRPTSLLLIKRVPVLKMFYKLFRMSEILSNKIPLFLFSNIFNRGVTFDNSIPSNDELNLLWDRSKPSKGFSLVRDAKYWHHRYTEHPLAEYNFHCARKKGCLEAIYVTRKFSSGKDKVSVSIVEWMGSGNVKFSYALAKILNEYNDSGVHYFHLWAQESSKEAKSAVSSLFLIRKIAPIIITNTPFSEDIITASNNIKFFLGSSDAI